ncbi:MAG TPA: citramalate synthase [Anaerolineae bacterium]|mgnify:CR=1 FL=1|nr:citramalate synthase [Anaerolineae bacterium]HQH39480.1 citramalate synthase [Anaerolineae bacterium]
MTQSQIRLYDTTLRDGTQAEGISLSVEDKLKITRLLDDLGVHYIEGGWPGSNPKDMAYFERVRSLGLQHAKITAFGSTCRVGAQPQDDVNIQALMTAGTPTVALVGKSWMLHVTDVLRATAEENLRIIRESVAYLKAQGKEVVYDAEHFFDGYKDNAGYALDTLRAAVAGGADVLVLCDTNGGTMPWEIEPIVGEVKAYFPDVAVGIHTHNDSGMADANTLAAVRAGAVHVQGTLNGYGERCGNANLCTLIPNLELKMGLRALPEGSLVNLTRTAHAAASIANQTPYRHAPYVGRSAFAHKGGIHAAALRRNPSSYQHVDPEVLGNTSRVVVSELSGKGNLLSKAEEAGIAHEELCHLPDVLQRIKTLEHKGFTFEGADASVEMMLYRSREGYTPPFQMIDFMVVVEHREGRGLFAEATMKLRVGDQVLHTAAEGNGPVNALDVALRKALIPVYPRLAEFNLADYKVHILDGEAGTAATTRVLIDVQNGSKRWSTVGASANIIEASWFALADAVEYGLMILSQG